MHVTPSFTQSEFCIIYKVLEGLNLNISGELLAMDIRHAISSLGKITGDVTTDDLLENIFSKLCIGK